VESDEKQEARRGDHTSLATKAHQRVASLCLSETCLHRSMAKAPLLAALCVQRWIHGTSSQRPGGTLPTAGRPVWVAPPGMGRAAYQVPTSRRGLGSPRTHNKGCHEGAAQAARGSVAALAPLLSVQYRIVRVFMRALVHRLLQ